MKIAVFEVREDEKAHLAALEKEFGVQLVLHEYPMTLDNMQACVAGCEAISTLGFSDLCRTALQQLAQEGIKYVSLRCIGYNHVDLDAALELGIRVANASYPPGAVADFTVLLMLLVLRKYKPAMWRQNVNDYALQGLMGRQMGGLTVGIVGTGRIGCTVMGNLSGFGCKMLCCDVHKNPDAERLGTYVDMETIYKQCDIISLHVPLMDSTYHMINERTIGKMKDGVILINTARGELCDIASLTYGVESQKIGAVGMDVLENEGGIYHHSLISDIIKNRDMAYLRQFPNVVLTQHMAFYTQESVESMVRCGIESIAAFESGQPYPHALV